MSGTETRLRELLEAAVGEPPGSISVPEVRRLARRRRRLHGVTGASASCAAVVVLAVGLAALGHSPAPLPAASPQPGVPRYYIQEHSHNQEHGILEPGKMWAQVRDTATGAVTAVIECPWAHSEISQIAPAGDDVFFMSCERTSGSSAGIADVVGTRLYRFQLTSAGLVPGYTSVPGGVLRGVATGELTAAADGSELAMNISTGQIDTLDFRMPGLLVINTRTGAHALWRVSGDPSRLAGADYQDLALSANGRDLRFLYLGGKESQVSPASRGGKLSSARVLVAVPSSKAVRIVDVAYARVSPDGSVLTLAELVLVPHHRNWTVLVEQVSVATGSVIRVLIRVADVRAAAFAWGGLATSDPTGRYIILNYSCGIGTSSLCPSHRVSNGWLDHGHLVPLTPANGRFPFYETW